MTQTADVAVKSAVIHDVLPGSSDAAGRNSSSAPATIAATKASTTYWAGWRSLSRRLDPRNANGTRGGYDRASGADDTSVGIEAAGSSRGGVRTLRRAGLEQL